MKKNSTTSNELPPPPREFYEAVRAAKPMGLWVKANRRDIPGQARYIVTEPSGRILYRHDDIDAVLGWLRG